MNAPVQKEQDGIIPPDQWAQLIAGVDEVEFGVRWMRMAPLQNDTLHFIYDCHPQLRDEPPHGVVTLRRDGQDVLVLEGLGVSPDGTLQEIACLGDAIQIVASTPEAHYDRVRRAGHRVEVIDRQPLTPAALATGLADVHCLDERLRAVPLPYTVPAEVVIRQMRDGLRDESGLAAVTLGRRMFAKIIKRRLIGGILAVSEKFPDVFALGARHLTSWNVHSANEDSGWLQQARQFAEYWQIAAPHDPRYEPGANSNDIACRLGGFFGLPAREYLQRATDLSFNCGATAMERLDRLSYAAGLATAAPVEALDVAAPVRPAGVAPALAGIAVAA